MSNAIEPISNKPITSADRERLSTLEQEIESGFAQFIQTGSALQEIHDKQYWRAMPGCTSFRDYLDKKWHIKKTYGYDLMAAAEEAKNLPGPSPTHENQVRPLKELPPEDRGPAYAEATERSDGHVPTAKVVQDVVDEKKVSAIADGRTAKTIGFDPEVIEKDRELKSALTVLKRICGEAFVKSITLGTVPFSRKDVLTLADSQDAAVMAGLSALIEDRRWTLKRATGFVATMIDEDSSVRDLTLHAIAAGGDLTADVNGWRITVVRKLNGHKHS